MKISTWNVNGIRARAAEVAQWIEREQPDVLCLQEVKASRADVPAALNDELATYWSYWHGHKGYSGVALLLRKESFPARPAFTHPEFDHENRIVQVRLGELTLASCYVPNGGKDFDAKLKFMQALEAWAGAQKQLVLCGDLNVAREERDVHPKLRKQDQIGTTPVERELFAKMLGHGLVDLQRRFSPDDDRLFTWWAPWRNQRERNIGWRIDYVLASEALAAKAVGCTGHREFGTSDHGPLQAVLDLAAPQYEAAPEPDAKPPPPGQIPLL
ncbi:MAG TPA: exodeoxyribonuclease III [Myxococcales bacterium]|nr:exodeoxyribonuclease III [Myxococcales bacterium]